ncbi:MAG: TetR/AcrR family transcriptional regulator [Gammaproteobacteria bacterium]|nr:TetR/AcrR family transcriptional regulator [Gammaproteobacteria bacterium]MDH3608295.1 TetR/AcrR family transcriptional regulator [Gammaproteobacteria bacterium]
MSRDIAQRHIIIPALGEIFRENGFAGTSLAEITYRTGLGKGSLYHFFPKGKKEMAEVVLDDVASWFEENVFLPLLECKNPKHGIQIMFKAVDDYFYSGERICLIGAFSLDDTRDQFASKLNSYFTSWNEALASALKRNGLANKQAKDIAEDVVASIQGALVLARSQDNPKVFTRALKRLQRRIETSIHE